MRTTNVESIVRSWLNEIIIASAIVWLSAVCTCQLDFMSLDVLLLVPPILWLSAVFSRHFDLVSYLWLLAPLVWIPLVVKASDQSDSARWSASAALCGCCIAASFC